MKYLLIIILSIGLSQSLYGQSDLTIKGVVREEVKTILPKATIVLKKQNKTTIKTISDKNGVFAFLNLRPGKFLLITNYLSFKSDTQQIYLKKDTSVFVNLINSSHELAEVEIKSSVAPVMVKNDTIVFNTKAYKTKPNASVGELLSMLPGVVIDKDGNVTMNGQKVDKVLIDGKSFFINDLKRATKSLPADIVSQVEVYKSESEAAQRAGIAEASITKTIDLKLKEDKKNGYTGKLYAGAGGNDNYAAGGELTRLSPREMLSADANMNDINNQFTGTENNNGGGSAGKQKLGSVNMNYRNELSKKLTVNAFLNYNYSRSNQQNSSSRNTFLNDSSLTENRLSNITGSQNNFKLGANLEYKPDDSNFLRYYFSWSPSRTSETNQDTTLLNIQKMNTGYIASKGLTSNGNQQQGNAFENMLMFSHRFKKTGRSLMFSFNQTFSDQNRQMDINTQVQAYNPPTNKVVDQQTTNPVHNSNVNANLTYQEPLSKKITFTVSYNYAAAFNRSNKSSNDLDPFTGQYSVPDTLTSNNFTTRMVTQQLKAVISNFSSMSRFSAVRDKFQFYLGVGEQSASQDNNNITHNVKSSTTYYNLVPQAQLMFTMKNNKFISFNYMGSSQSPTTDQLQPLPDLSNPYLQKIGNPDLRQSFTHMFLANYNAYNINNFQNIQFSAQGDIIQHQISRATSTLSGGVQQEQYVNLDGVYHLNAGVSFGFPLIKQENGTGFISVKTIYGNDESIINGKENASRSEGVNTNFQMRFHHGKSLFINCMGSIQYQGNHYSLVNETNSKTMQKDFGIDITYMLPVSMSTGIIYNYQYRKTGNLSAQQTNLLNAFIAKDIIGSAAQLRLSGFNLLDASSSISQNTGPNYIETTKTNTLHRFGLLSLVYNFNKFGRANKMNATWGRDQSAVQPAN
ncbi:MAG: outer membrane beta-barrel protein [Bacteroidota bacterium]